MDARLEKLFCSLEEQRERLIKELENISSNALNHKRSEKWSISEIIGHLISAEQLSIAYINKKINAIQEVGSTGIWGEIKLRFFIVSQRLPLRYKAPKMLGEKPTPYPDVAAIENSWSKSREELKNLLERFSSHELRKKIYRHPVMGRSNIVHTLIFFREHIIHHYPQIKKQL